MKRIDDLISLVEDTLLVARAQESLINPSSVKNKNGGEGFVVFHLKAIKEGLEELSKEV